MKRESKVNYAFALKNYQQNGRGRSMKKFCEEKGYDYEKFMLYSRRCQKEYSVLKEADARQTSDKFIPLVVDGPAESILGILNVQVRFPVDIRSVIPVIPVRYGDSFNMIIQS